MRGYKHARDVARADGRPVASSGARADGAAHARARSWTTMAFILGGFSHLFAFKGAFQAEVRGRLARARRGRR